MNSGVEPEMESSDWRSRWLVTVASDVSKRDGIGWEFANLECEGVWAVFREDGGAFPVFSAMRGTGALPAQNDLQAMTQEAVADLLAAAGLPDSVGWIAKNITAALLFASHDFLDWEGEEWSLESDNDDVALHWAVPSDGRVPFAWIRGVGVGHESVVGIYQDDAYFGLCFLPLASAPKLPAVDQGSLRSRRDVPVVTGRIRKVEVVLDTLVEGSSKPGLVTEVLLHGDTSSTLLVAAEAYSRNEWHLYDESVVVLPDPKMAEYLRWIPARQHWRPTATPSGRVYTP